MQSLIDAGILKEMPEKETIIPWFSLIIILFVSLLGGVGVIALLFALEVIDTNNLLFLGIIAIIFASIMSRSVAQKSIENHYLIFLLLITGEILLVLGLRTTLEVDFSIILFILAMLQIPLFIFIDDYLQRIFNITIFTISISTFSQNYMVNHILIIMFIIIYTAYIIYITFNEKGFFVSSWFYQIKDAFMVNILILLFLPFFYSRYIDEVISLKVLFISLVSILGLYTLYKLLTIYNIKNLLIYPLVILLLVAFYPTPALVVLFILLALSSYQKNNLQMIVSLVAIVIFIGYWYYSLEFSLLYKSLSMIFIGLLMLSTYYIRNRA